MISDLISEQGKIQPCHMKDSDPMRCGSCWKGLEMSLVNVRAIKAPAGSPGGCGRNLVGMHLLLAVWLWASYSTSLGSRFHVYITD